MNAGYGRAPGEENRLVDFGGRDANGNRLIVDGVIQTGEDQSVFARAGGGGVAGSMSGVGALGGSSTAIGNNLVVVTQGSWNTVIVNSSQTNNGNVTAGSNTSGGVGGN
jgi:holdfast attachment protein HfaA